MENGSESRYKVGYSAPPIGGESKVTGKTRYVADLVFPGMLYGKLLYTTCAPALIKRIDTSKALESAGVVAVMTAADIPGLPYYHYVLPDMPVLGIDQVRYLGEAVAMVAAETKEQAEDAIEKIIVEYEPIPGIFDPQDAMKEGARRIQEDKPNILDHSIIEHGNLEKGFQQAAVVVEGTYRTQLVEHAFLEVEAAVATCDVDKRITVYSSTQCPHKDRRQLAAILGLPEPMVRVIVPAVGGAFGGKAELHVQPHAALLSWKTGRPVKIVRTREESIKSHIKRVPMIIHYKTGASSEGKLTAVKLEIIGDAGPYANATFEVLGFAILMGTGPYEVPNARLEGYTVLTNNVITGAFRGFGLPQMHFACEQQMDRLAEKLGMDPLEIRLKNSVKQGSQLATKATVYHPSGLPEVLRAVTERANWKDRSALERQPAPHLRRGIGLACCWQGVGLGAVNPDHASVNLEMVSDGGVILRCGATDMGQGLATVMTQMVTEELKVPWRMIRLIGPDTDITLDCLPSEASRQTYVTGSAVIDASRKLLARIFNVAAEKFGCATDDLVMAEGEVICPRSEESISLPDLYREAYSRRIVLSTTGFAQMPTADIKEITFPFAFSYFSCNAQVAQVLVDIETGEVKVEHLMAAQDVGKAINPLGVEGQVVGGVVQGIGWSILEELVYDKEQCATASLHDYLIPTTMDIPKIETVIVEVNDPEGPYGARGIGEAPITPTAAAIANAVADALGVRMERLPITPERILGALAEKGIGG
ncbi:MAG: xanthine dehydrogenase family protein [Anaerolineales bacterium]|nr:xanthine dehydrogenase family protein [Anaerolineales bacterium]